MINIIECNQFTQNDSFIMKCNQFITNDSHIIDNYGSIKIKNKCFTSFYIMKNTDYNAKFYKHIINVSKFKHYNQIPHMADLLISYIETG